MFAAVRGTRIYFDVEGMGLVPDGHSDARAAGGDGDPWRPGRRPQRVQAGFTPLAARMQLVYFDHRGQGRSDAADPATYTLDENVEDMEALRRHLGLGPIVSIGTSYGGMVAMAHAARYPDAVSHLVLIVTAAHGGFIPRAQAIVRERGTAGAAGGVRDGVGGRVPLGGGDAALLCRDGSDVCADVMTRRRERRVGRGRSIRRSRSTARSGRRVSCDSFDLRAELARITAPTLVLAGRHDWICPPEFSEEIARADPRRGPAGVRAEQPLDPQRRT